MIATVSIAGWQCRQQWLADTVTASIGAEPLPQNEYVPVLLNGMVPDILA